MPTYPLRYMTVAGNLSAIIADSEDVGDLPDNVSITGKIEFRLVTGDDYVLCPDADTGPTIKYVGPVTATIDADGDIEWQGLKYVKLFTPDEHTNPTTAYYSVRFLSLKYGNTSVTIDGFNFDAVPDATIDLASVARVPGTKASPVVRGPAGFAIDSVALSGDDLLFHRSDGVTLPPVNIPDLSELASATDDAMAAADSAEADALTASTSAASALTSMGTAVDAMNTAATIADESADSADASAASAAAALASETAAATSATNAAGSATAAAASATAADASADAAAISETNAETAELSATDLAAIAGAAASLAVASAEEVVLSPSAQSDWNSPALTFGGDTIAGPAWLKRRLTGNSVIGFGAGTSGKAYTVTLEIVQDATGGRTLGWSGVTWSFGVPPTMSTAANAKDIYHITWTGFQWVGTVGAQAIA